MLAQGKARDCAMEVRLEAHEVESVLANTPPQLQLDQAELADAKWFQRQWLQAHLQGLPLPHCYQAIMQHVTDRSASSTFTDCARLYM